MAEGGLGEKMVTQRIAVSDNTNGAETAGSFVIDMETSCHNDASTSKVTLHRNLSRKGSQRGGGTGDKKTNSTDWNSIVSATSSPRGVTASSGDGIPGSPARVVAAGNHGSNSQQAHQITIDASSTCAEGGKGILRRNNSRRYSTWGLDPKRIFILFASVSSMGTMLMIYFTLMISHKAEEDSGMDLG